MDRPALIFPELAQILLLLPNAVRIFLNSMRFESALGISARLDFRKMRLTSQSAEII